MDLAYILKFGTRVIPVRMAKAAMLLVWVLGWLGGSSLAGTTRVCAGWQDISEARSLFHQGKFSEVIELSKTAIASLIAATVCGSASVAM